MTKTLVAALATIALLPGAALAQDHDRGRGDGGHEAHAGPPGGGAHPGAGGSRGSPGGGGPPGQRRGGIAPRAAPAAPAAVPAQNGGFQRGGSPGFRGGRGVANVAGQAAPPAPPRQGAPGYAYRGAPAYGGQASRGAPPRGGAIPGAGAAHGRGFVYRGAEHPRFRTGGFRYPSGWGYRPWRIGQVLPGLFLGGAYWWNDYYDLGLPPPPPGFRWVRYGPDLILVNPRTGYIADVIYGVFY